MRKLAVSFATGALAIGALATALPAQKAQSDPGKYVFDRWCASCHSPSVRSPGTTALAAKYGKEVPAALEQRKDLDPDVVKAYVRNGISIMPPFRKTEISDAELNALADYLDRSKQDTKK